MGTDHTLATLRARPLPAGLADALQALVVAAREKGYGLCDFGGDRQTAETEDAALTAMLDQLAPVLRDHEAMQAMREKKVDKAQLVCRVPEIWRISTPANKQALVYDPVDGILALAKPEVAR